MADFSTIKSFFLSKKFAFYTFFPKSQKPIKAVIRHLSPNTPAEEICEALVELGFDTISVRQMTTTRRSPSQDSEHSNLPLYFITLPRTEKPQDIFKLTGLCHISIKMEAYRNQNGLTQSYNCQKFGHVWANCSQPPRCMWCGGDHLHKDGPEKTNNESTPTCCNCKLVDGEKTHPSNYRGCRHAEKEIRRRRTHRTPKMTTGKKFTSNYSYIT
jgi:PAX-interacting protein 1